MIQSILNISNVVVVADQRISESDSSIIFMNQLIQLKCLQPVLPLNP